jgi:hypothetical protein
VIESRPSWGGRFKRGIQGGISRAVAFLDFFREGKVRMSKANGPLARIKIPLGIALLTALTGCLGVVGDGGDYEDDGGAVIVTGPDLFIFGGGYDRGRDEHDYGRRGHESRAVAHSANRAPAHQENRAPAHQENRAPAHPAAGGHEGKR